MMLLRLMLYLTTFHLLTTANSRGASDAWVTMKAKLAVAGVNDVSLSNVHVDTTNGVVTLFGKVPDAGAKAEVESKCGKIDGVKRIDSLLQIVPSEQAKSTQKSDEAIAKDAMSALKQGTGKSDSIKVLSVDKGVVVLGGKAQTPAGHVYAVDRVSRVPGVRRIETRVDVENDVPVQTIYSPTEGKDLSTPSAKDAWLTTQVKLALFAEADVPSLQVHVDTNDAIVTLFGKVNSEKAKNAAVTAAKRVSGVRKVNDALALDPQSEPPDRVTDSDVAADVRRLLSSEGIGAIEVFVKDGVVALSGKVPDEAEKLRAVMLSRGAKGARAVKDTIRVQRN